MRRRGPWLLAALLFGAVWAAAPAAAHTVLVGAAPDDGATLTEPVDAVVLRFNEPVQERFAEVVVTAPDGERVDVDAPTVAGAEVTQPLAPLEAHGVYEVRYTVLAMDDHPVAGALRFELHGSHSSADEGSSHVEADPVPSHTDQFRDSVPPAAAVPPPAPERRSLLPLAVLLAAALAAATVDGLRRTRVVVLPEDADDQVVVVVVDVTDLSASRSRR